MIFKMRAGSGAAVTGTGGRLVWLAWRLVAIALGVCVVLASVVAPAFAHEATATMAAVAGDAEVRLPGSGQWLRAERGTRLGAGTRVRTGEDASASIAIGAGAMLELGPETDVLLAEDGTHGTDGDASIVVKQFEGHIELELRLQAHHYLKSTVVTPHAAVNMRTQFRFQILKVSVGPDETEVEAVAGEAEVLVEGSTIDLRTGDAVVVPAGGAPEGGGVSQSAVLDLSQSRATGRLREAHGAPEQDGDREQAQDRDRDRDRDQAGPGDGGGGQCEDPPFGEAEPNGPQGSEGEAGPAAGNGPNGASGSVDPAGGSHGGEGGTTAGGGGQRARGSGAE